MKRRDFIKLSLSAASMILIPINLNAKENNKKTMILLELDGGNDGLNTLVPFYEKNYYKLRPTIALKKDDINLIDRKFGLNKNLQNLTNIYKEKHCAIIQGLGYDNPNLSHFRSIEIVETASESDEYASEGWIANELRRFDLSDVRPTNALIIGKRKKGDLFSNDLNILQVRDINTFIKKSSQIKIENSKAVLNDRLSFLENQEKSIQRANESFSKYAKDIKIKEVFKDTDISKDFKEALKIIKSKIDIPIIKISQKGYDTHANQIERQNKLLKELDDAIGSFVKELKNNNLFDDVLIVTYSEFGRRVKENGSNGTDHGTASCQFVIGGKVKGGIYGKAPNLKNLVKNNLIYTTHYRSYYNTILTSWFGNENNKFNTYKNMKFL